MAYLLYGEVSYWEFANLRPLEMGSISESEGAMERLSTFWNSYRCVYMIRILKYWYLRAAFICGRIVYSIRFMKKSLFGEVYRLDILVSE